MLVFLAAVVVGKVGAVTFGAFLTGQSVQTSVKSGMSLAQIGEFSFIIAGLGIATGATDNVLYSIAVAVSGITTLLTPWLIRAAQPTAAWIDRKLPRSLQTFVAVYGSWLEQLKANSAQRRGSPLRGHIRWMTVDAVVVAAVVISASLEMERLSGWAQSYVGVSPRFSKLLIVVAAAAVSAPFWIGMVRMARYLGFELADRVFPRTASESFDIAAAPRRLLVVTLQLAIVVLVGLPLVAITQPFVPLLQGAVVLILLLGLLTTSFWRGAANFTGHTKAAAQALAEALAQRTREGKAAGSAQEARGRRQHPLGHRIARAGAAGRRQSGGGQDAGRDQVARP